MPAGTDRTPPGVEKPRKSTDGRKSSKPIMEKRRRARINESLSQLKTLILEALKTDSSRHSKLEKADILEMTVKHLRNLQRLQLSAAANADPSVLGKFRDGFSECVGEVTRFLSTCEGVNSHVQTRLLTHLAACASQIHGVGRHGLRAAAPGFTQEALPRGSSATPASSEALKLYGGFQVVPVPDGQFAFLVPSAALGPLVAQGSGGASVVAPPLTSDSVWRPW